MTATIQWSESESNRFNLRVFRLVSESIDAETLVSAMITNRADVVVLRVPSEQLAQLHRLDRSGIPHLVAGTLVYYHADLGAEAGQLSNPEMRLRRCDPEDAPKLATMVEKIFHGYVNHYSANPLLATDDILAGYAEWATSYIDRPGRVAFFAELGGSAVGFATCSFEADSCEGVLYGVAPDAAGQGVYTDIVRLTKRHFGAAGFRRMVVSTQTENVAVQRAWVREAFTLAKSYATIHLNPLFAASARDPHEFDYTVTSAASETYGEASGDYNPVHFDRKQAQSLGFEESFAHGLVANGIISEFFGMQYPGPGTVFSGYRYAFLGPLYQNRTYRVRIAFPVIKPNGFHRATVTFTGDEGLVLLAYCDLFRRPE